MVVVTGTFALNQNTRTQHMKWNVSKVITEPARRTPRTFLNTTGLHNCWTSLQQMLLF